jgi:hypothetical protein
MTGFSVAFASDDDKARQQLNELIAAQNHSR